MAKTGSISGSRGNLPRDVVFVANGNAQIGWGHLVRTGVLVHGASTRGLTSILVTFEGADLLPIRQSGVKFAVLPVPGTAEYEEALVSFLTERESSVIVFDLLSGDRQKHRFLRTSLPDLKVCSICSFQPTKDEVFFEDFLVYPGLDDEPISVGPTIHRGLEYLIFRSAFVKAQARCQNRLVREAPVVLVTMGGGDQVGLTVLAVKALSQCKKNIQVRVVVTNTTSELPEIERLTTDHNFTLLRNTPVMAEEILNCDLGIINGGMLRYEFALLERFFIAISLHEVQFGITERLTSQGLGLNFGIYDRVASEELAVQVESTLTETKEKAFAGGDLKVDTLGAQRILNLIEDWI